MHVSESPGRVEVMKNKDKSLPIGRLKILVGGVMYSRYV